MAKISVRGATEIARLRGQKTVDGDTWSVTFVLTSDGRVLRKSEGQSGYSFLGRLKDPKNRNADYLRKLMRLRFGYDVK